MLDKINQEVNVGDSMIFSAGQTVGIYEILKVKESSLNPSWDQVFVNVGASKKWKYACDGIKFN